MTTDLEPSDRLARALSGLREAAVPPWLAARVIERVRGDGDHAGTPSLFRRWLPSLAAGAVLIVVFALALPSILPPTTPGEGSPPESSAAAPPSQPLSSGLASPSSAPTAAPPTETPATSVSPPPGETASLPAPSATALPTLPPITRTVEATSEVITGPLLPRFNASGVWTGSELIIWGGSERPLSNGALRFGNGAAYNPSSGTWRTIADSPLAARDRHLAAWTGQEMLIWGGDSGGTGLDDGAAYDPATNTWREIADAPLRWTAPREGQDVELATLGAAGVWTGSEWVVARAARQTDLELLEFAAYDPVADSWRSLPSLEASTSSESSMVWTGAELVISTGMYRLSAAGDDWLPVPPMRVYGNLVWTGTRVMVVNLEYLGTDEPRYRLTLAAWDPISDRWELLPDPAGNLPESRLIWADGRVLLPAANLVVDVASGQWWGLEMPPTIDRLGAVEVWLGDRLAIWGGGSGDPATVFDAGLIIIPGW